MANAFILIETTVGQTKDAFETLLGIKIKGIKSIDMVTGPYDIIVALEYDDMNAIGKLIVDNIHKVPGIARSVTCMGIRLKQKYFLDAYNLRR